MGYFDFSCFGSEIVILNIDSLVYNGLWFI